jgi:hypothetical protein
MSTSINVTEYKQLLTIHTQLKANGCNIPLQVIGKHALGKSEIPEQWAADNNYNFIPLFGALMNPEDFLGIPYRENGVQRFTMPDWMADAINDPRPALIVIDEFNRSKSELLQAMFQLILRGEIHKHKLRPCDYVMACSNPDSAEYNVTTFEDEALNSRFSHFYFEPEVNEWTLYANNKIHSAIIDIVQSSNIFKNESVDTESRISNVGDRRNIFKIGQALQILDEETINRIGYKFISGAVGQDLAAVVLNAYRNCKSLNSKDVLSGKIFDGKFDFEKHIDQINVINEDFTSIITDKSFNMPWTEDEVANIKKYLQTIPCDCKFGFVRNLKYAAANLGIELEKIVKVLNTIYPTFIEEAILHSSKD